MKATRTSAGLDYPGIGPEHSWLHDNGRVKYPLLSKLGRIISALEPAHAIAKVVQLAPERPKDHPMG